MVYCLASYPYLIKLYENVEIPKNVYDILLNFFIQDSSIYEEFLSTLLDPKYRKYIDIQILTNDFVVNSVFIKHLEFTDDEFIIVRNCIKQHVSCFNCLYFNELNLKHFAASESFFKKIFTSSFYEKLSSKDLATLLLHCHEICSGKSIKEMCQIFTKLSNTREHIIDAEIKLLNIILLSDSFPKNSVYYSGVFDVIIKLRNCQEYTELFQNNNIEYSLSSLYFARVNKDLITTRQPINKTIFGKITNDTSSETRAALVEKCIIDPSILDIWLRKAVEQHSLSLVKLIAEQGHPMDVLDGEGKTPYLLAKISNSNYNPNNEVIDFLISQNVYTGYRPDYQKAELNASNLFQDIYRYAPTRSYNNHRKDLFQVYKENSEVLKT